MIGRTLGHYRIEGRLGRGGMGEVFVAEDTRLGRRVALKVLSSQLVDKPDQRARFEREAKTVAALNHPNIVTIHSVEQIALPDLGEVFFITMEYVEGRALSDVIPEGGLGLDEMLELAIPLADAVGTAHEAGITHRDLKPENIMVTKNGRVKVLDFGLAKLRDVSDDGSGDTREIEDCVTEEGKILGTVAYMSPEQAEGKSVGPASDVFSLGIVLYQMATGRRPFAGDSHISTILSIMRDTPQEVSDVNPGLPPGFSSIVERCLVKSAVNRFSSGAELHHALNMLRSGDGLSSGVLDRWKHAKRRRFAMVALVIAAVLAGGAYVAWMLLDSAGEPENVERSIAVLPFKNLSADQENEYFSDGITVEITNKLAGIKDLDVSSLTSAARYKQSRQDVRDIGRELGVRYVLEGTVRKAGNRVRISAQLIDAVDGFQMWSDDFEGILDDVFAVQEETALRIADALDLRLSPDEQEAVLKRYTANSEAYDAYLRGRALIEYFASSEKMEEAERHFERALSLDPDYAPALVGMSRVQAQYYRNLDPKSERLERARELANRALDLDPKLAEAHLAMGQVFANQYRYDEAARRFRAAIRIEPENAYAWDLLSWALAYQQPPDAAAAERAARKSISLQASLIGAHYHLGRALLLQNRYEEAEASFRQSKNLDPDFEAADFGLAQVCIGEGRYREAIGVLEGLDELLKAPVVPVQLAIAHAALGEIDPALAALEQALEYGYGDAAGLEEAPQLEQLRQDPRYEELLERHGMGR